MISLYPHQVENARALLTVIKAHGAALDCSETGTGKSFTALAVARALRLKPYVICPLSVGPAWDIKFKQAGIVGSWINYEKARRSNFKMDKGGKQFLIFDECHRCKAPASQQAKMMARLTPQHPSLLLSATPFSSPLETRALLHSLGVRDWQRWYSLLPKLGCFQNENFHNAWMWKGRDADIALLHEMVNPFTVKTKWSDMEGFPDNVIHAEALRVKDKDAFDKAYEALSETNKLTEQLRQRMIIEQHRVPAMIDMANDLLAQGVSPVAFFNFTEPLLDYAQGLDTTNVIHGETKTEDRRRIVSDFQASKVAMPIACNIRAGGEGIDLHDTVGVARVSLISPTWSAQDLKQALGRIHRSGAKSKAVQRICFAAGTVEDAVLTAVNRKLSNIDKLTDKDLAVMFSPLKGGQA